MSKYLGIDYGLSHIGLATSEHTLASPLPSLPNSPSIYTLLASLVLKEGITHLVCGIPEGRLAPIIKDFADRLADITGLPVILHPETLTTKDAKRKLVESGASRAKKNNDHAYAACLIPEDYLELHPVLY